MTVTVILVTGALTLPLTFDEQSADAKKSKKSKKTTRKTKKASIEAGGSNGGVAENGGTSSGGNGGSGTGGVGGSACFEIGICSNVTANNNQKIQQN